MTKLLTKIFLIRKVYAIPRWRYYLLTCFVFGLIAVLIPLTLVDDKPLIMVLSIAVWLYFVGRASVIMVLMNHRLATKLVASDPRNFERKIVHSVLYEEITKEAIDTVHTKPIASDTGWKQYEVRLNNYSRSKYGTYLAGYRFYSVMEVKLSRFLPNIVFDSKHERGWQYKHVYLGTQKLSFEGNFDNSFNVYAPDFYKIDTLSFITPEVMLAFMEAHEFDIEIVDDRLFLYGPPLLSESQAQRMRTLALAVGHEINDNIDTYADSYLSGDARRTNTTQFARRLLKNPAGAAVICCLAVAGLIVLAALGVVVDRLWFFNEFSLIIATFAIFSGLEWRKIVHTNRRNVASFAQERKLHATQS